VLAVASPTEPWTATSHAPWLHVDAAHANGTNSGNVVFTFDGNPGATRTARSPWLVRRWRSPSRFNLCPRRASPAGHQVGESRGIAVDAAGRLFGEYSSKALKRWKWHRHRHHAGRRCRRARGSGPGQRGQSALPDDSTEWVLTWNAADGTVNPSWESPGEPLRQGRRRGPRWQCLCRRYPGQAVYRYAPEQQGRHQLFSSEFSQDAGVAADAAGNVYFADTGSRVVGKWTAASGTFTTFQHTIRLPGNCGGRQRQCLCHRHLQGRDPQVDGCQR